MGTGTRTSHSLSEELGSELVTDGGFDAVTQGVAVDSGLLTIGNCYKIALRTDGDFIAAGSPDNVAGTYFNATTTGVGLLDAGDTVNPITFTSWTAGAEWAPQAVSGALTGKANKIAGTASDLVQATAAGNIDTAAVTLANTKISAVAGTAFVDFSAADILTDHVGKGLTIKDSAGKVISGHIKAAGTGETYGTEMITNGNMEADSGWADFNIPTSNTQSNEQAHGGTFSRKIVSPGGYTGAQQTGIPGVIAGNLYYMSVWFYGDGVNKATVATQGSTVWYGVLSINDLGYVFPAAWTKDSKYMTATAVSDFAARFYSGNNAITFYVDDFEIYKVLTPSATGVTIVSTPGGATYNWTYQQSGFDYNDAAGYTYYIDDIKVNRIAATVVRTAGTLNSNLDGVDGASITADGIYYDNISAPAGVISIQAAVDFAGTIDAVSCKEIVRRGTPD